MGTGDVSPGVKLSDREDNHHVHLVPRLRMRGAIVSLPHTSSFFGA